MVWIYLGFIQNLDPKNNLIPIPQNLIPIPAYIFMIPIPIPPRKEIGIIPELIPIPELESPIFDCNQNP